VSIDDDIVLESVDPSGDFNEDRPIDP